MSRSTLIPSCFKTPRWEEAQCSATRLKGGISQTSGRRHSGYVHLDYTRYDLGWHCHPNNYSLHTPKPHIQQHANVFIKQTWLCAKDFSLFEHLDCLLDFNQFQSPFFMNKKHLFEIFVWKFPFIVWYFLLAPFILSLYHSKVIFHLFNL